PLLPRLQCRRCGCPRCWRPIYQSPYPCCRQHRLQEAPFLRCMSLSTRTFSSSSSTNMNQITARAFTTRSTSYEGPIEAAVNEDSPQIRHRKMFLRGYLIKLCTDPTRMEFWEYMNKVGQMHVGQGRKHPLHVEYIHMNALLGYVTDILIEAILSHPRLELQQKTAVVSALKTIIWIQNGERSCHQG